MNIHIEHNNLLKVLHDSTIQTFEFGSKLYSLDNKDSDVDDIAVIAQNQFFANTFLWEHHTLQEATTCRDTIYTTMQLLVRNLMTGDSTAYFEVLHSDECKGSILEFLYERREWFYNFTTIRAFLGYARRDIKHATDSCKRFAHAIRCYYTAKMIFDDNFYTNDFRNYDNTVYDYMKKLKNETHGMSNRELHHEIKQFKHDIDSLRKTVSESFNSNQRSRDRYMSVERLKEIDRFVMEFNKEHWYDASSLDDLIVDQLYHALENGVHYG